MAEVIRELPGNFLDRQDEVDRCRSRTRAAHHAVIFGAVLGEREAACSLIARSPMVPSLPVPERMTQAALLALAWASDWKKASIGCANSAALAGEVSMQRSR